MFEFIDVKYKNIISIPTLKINKGEITSLVGVSGSGKTTVLRLLNKMLSPTEGKVLFKGTDLCDINSVEHRRRVALLSQNPVMFEGDIRDNLNIGLKFQDRNIAKEQELIAVLERVKLSKALNSPVNTLSGGEKQRLALARLILISPLVYLLDEPSSALDEETEEFIIEMVAEHVRAENKTLVMVTHSKDIANKYSNTIVTLSSGICQAKGV